MLTSLVGGQRLVFLSSRKPRADLVAVRGVIPVGQGGVPLLRSGYVVRVRPFRTFRAFFDVSHRANARRTCSPSPIPSRCLTFLRPAASAGSKRKVWGCFGTLKDT